MVPLTYTEYRPGAQLAPWVACFWQIRGCLAHTALEHRVLPDGCADLVLDLANVRRMGGRGVEVVGPMLKPRIVTLAGEVDTLGIRLRPGAFAVFGGIPADRLLDSSVPLSELHPPLHINADELARLEGRARVEKLAVASKTGRSRSPKVSPTR